MSKQDRKHFTPEFRLEVAQLVMDKNYSVRDATELMSVGKSTVYKWARQLRLGYDVGVSVIAL
jgi:transposase-like protein